MRYLPHTQEDIDQMLAKAGQASLDNLFTTIPDELKTKKPLDLPEFKPLFEKMEQHYHYDRQQMEEASIEQLEQIWQSIKNQ